VRRLHLITAISLLAGIAGIACTAETTTSASPADSTSETTPPDEDPGSDPGQTSSSGTPAKDAGTKKDSGGTSSSGGSSGTSGCTTKKWYKDGDGDGYGLASSSTDSCTQPSGYVADKTDCDDTKSSVKPGATEYCDAVDENCDGNVNGSTTEAAACTAAAGSYSGTFTIYTAEKLGSTIINQMSCSGTFAGSVNLSSAVVVNGTTTCTYSGSLGGFDKTQTGTVEGAIKLDGTFEGKLTHVFGSGMTHTFTIGGTAKNGRIDVNSTGGWYPNAMSAVPWDTTITISSSK